MKQYPHIEPYYDSKFIGEYCYAFDKIDGSSFRSEWDRRTSKKSNFGFKKFGTRTQMITKSNHPFALAADIFMDKYADDLDKIFTEDKFFRGVNKITVFGEYYGENSFAGLHNPSDEKDVKIFDILVERKGFVKPNDFIDIFGHLDIPTLVYQGVLTQEFIDKVRNNEFDLMEGVVCKGVRQTKGNEVVWLLKIKSQKWLDRVKEKYGEKRLLEEFDGKIPIFTSKVL